MKKIVFVVLILFYSSFVFTQYKDSYEQKSSNYFEASKKIRFTNLDSLIIYSKNIQEFEKLNKSVAITAFRETILSLYYLEKYTLLQAEQKAQHALSIFTKLKYNYHIAYVKSVLGRVYQNKSDYVKASSYFFQSNEIARKNNFSDVLILNNKNLAFLFLDQNNIEKSLQYALEANKIAQKTKDTYELGFINGILGEIYRTNKEPIKSQNYFAKSFQIFTKLNLEYGIAWTLTNWSILEGSDFEKGFEMRKKAQKIWDKVAPNNVISIANQYNIGYDFLDLYQTVNDYKHIKSFNVSKSVLLDSTFFYFNKSLKIAEKEDNTYWKMYCYGAITEVYFFRQDINKYADFNDKYHTIKDSLFSQENKNKIASNEISRQMLLRDNQLRINKLSLEANQKQKWLLFSCLGFLAIIGGLLFYQSRKRLRTNEKLQLLNENLDQANKIKTRFFNILNHDLRSPVANLIDFLHIQKNAPDLLDESSKNRIQETTLTSAENLLVSMEDILLWSKGQMENFKPQPKNVAVNQLFDDTKKVFSGYVKINFEYQNPENIEIFTDENYLKTIIRNLTSNAINVFTTTENPTIVWKAWQENGKSYLSITDNGSGAGQENFKALYDDTEVVGIKSGLGLHLIRDLAKAIDCEISVDSKIGIGTTFTLKLA